MDPPSSATFRYQSRHVGSYVRDGTFLKFEKSRIERKECVYICIYIYVITNWDFLFASFKRAGPAEEWSTGKGVEAGMESKLGGKIYRDYVARREPFTFLSSFISYRVIYIFVYFIYIYIFYHCIS